MAHALTRLEGFEAGAFLNILGDATTGNVVISSASADKISGDYGCVITNNGIAAANIVVAWSFEGDGDSGNTAAALHNAASYRIGLIIKSYPSTNGLRVIELQGTGGAARSIFTMSTTGVLTLDGVAGTTALALNTPYEITGIFDSSGSGTHSVRLRPISAQARSQEFTNVAPSAPATNGTILRIQLGKTGNAGSYTIAVDNLSFEGSGAGTVALIDYPLAGGIIAMDPDGNGTCGDAWGITGAATRWEAVQRPHNGDTSYIAISNVGCRRQSFTLEDPVAAGIPSDATINGVQFCQMVRRNATGAVAVRIIAAASNISCGANCIAPNLTELTSDDIPPTSAYTYEASCQQNSPFTALPWVHSALVSMVSGVRASNSGAAGVEFRASTIYVLVDFSVPIPPSGGGGSDVHAGSNVPVTPTVSPDVVCVSVIFDPNGPQEYDLGGRLSQAQALRQERDILLRSYRASDASMQFADTDELFIETNPLSFLRDPSTGQPSWFGKRVLVAFRLGTEVLTRYIGQVLEAAASRGVGQLRIADRFQAMFDRPLLANSVGRIVSTSGAFGLGPALGIVTNAPATGWFLGNVTLLNQSPATRNKATKCQTWTLTFTSDAIPDGTTLPSFFVTGSVTGFDGEGQYGVPGSFTSKSGQIAIDTSRPGDIREDARAIPASERTAPKNSTTSIRTVWRPGAGSRTVQAMRQLLVDWRGVNLTAAEIDPSLDALVGTDADQLLPTAEFIPTISRLSFDETFNLLAAVQALALHLGCSFIEKANGNIGVASFMPRVVRDIPELCNSDDLMDLTIEHLPIYNEYTVEHAFSESNDKFTQGFASPDPDDNDSFQKYDKIFPAPSTMQFRGFDGSNLPWMQSIALALYDRYKDPRRIYTVKAKAVRLDADMGDVFSVNSLVPTINPSFTEPVSIERNITGSYITEMELVEVDSEIVSGECGGYLGLDTLDTRLDDDCWGVF
jgi:hypothetical protein